jgi:hypothetical protein
MYQSELMFMNDLIPVKFMRGKGTDHNLLDDIC